MKRISPILYLCVLMLTLVLAYFSWTQGPKKPGGEVKVLECGEGDIETLTIREKNRTVTFTRKKSAWSGEASWWVEASRLPFSPGNKRKKSAEEALVVDVESVSPAPEETAESETAVTVAEAAEVPAREDASSEQVKWTVIEVFKGNKKLQEALDKFCPWKALRALGRPGEEKREEFGLKDTEDHITLVFSDGPHRFLIGKTTFGPKDRYVGDEKTGEIFLVAGKSFKDLLYPKSRFMERNLHDFKQEDVERLRIRAEGREEELIHKVSEQGEDEGWADSSHPTEIKEMYKNWVRKLLQLRPIEYVIPGQAATETGSYGCETPESSEIVASFTFLGEKEEIGFLTIYKKEGDPGKTDYYACTENTGAVVKISKTQSESLMGDMDDILSGS